MPTRILLSVAMANHGWNYAHWLQNKLTLVYNLYGYDAVYLDCIVARNTLGDVNIRPDLRAHMRSPTRAFPIGAQRDDWNALFLAALRQCDILIVSYTEEYRASRWCMQEWDQFLLERRRRIAEHLPEIRAVVLVIPAPARCRLPMSNNNAVTVLNVNRGPGRGLAWDRGDFTLTDDDFGLLVAAIGNL